MSAILLPAAPSACACGRAHGLSTETLVYEDRATARLPEALARLVSGRRAVLLADPRTYEAAGRDAESALTDAGWSVRRLLAPDGPRGEPVCDDATRDALLARWPEGDAVVAVGSGVINDLAKWIADGLHRPYAVVPTAASMNGYISATVAPAIRGVKRVVPASVPRAVLAEPAVLEQAPYPLTAAGLGDALAKPVSLADWRLGQVLFGDPYCEFCAGLIRGGDGAFERPEALRARDPAAVRALFEALIRSGAAMTYAGTSAPASGGEHMLSHVLDMQAGLDGTPHDYHGRQVGVGTIFAAALYERLLALEAPEFRAECGPTDTAYWRGLAGPVEEEYALKRRKAGVAARRLRADPGLWDRIRSALAPLTLPAARVKDCLRRAGAAHRLEDIGCSRDRFLSAAAHAHEIRERYTVIDLARAAGVLPGAARELVEAWLA